MKLVRSFAFFVVLVGLAFAAFPAASPARAQGARPTPHPCQEPAGFDQPVADAWVETDSTAPRLLGVRDAMEMLPGPEFPQAGLSIAWANFGWGAGSAFWQEVLYSGLWALPRTGALTLDGGRGAVVTVHTGEVVLLVCGAGGFIDTQYGDGVWTDVAEGSSTPMQAGTSFYISLTDSPATYWLFGHRQGADPESIVTIDIIGSNGGPRVCGLTVCWPAPVLPAKPNGANCDGITCEKPTQPGGCGWIFCWTK